MDLFLNLYSLLFLTSYISWIVFSRKENLQLTKLASAGMSISVLLIIIRIFMLQTDFGLILGAFVIFSFLSILTGMFIRSKELTMESTSYFLILLIIFCIRSFWYEPYQIPSRSMVPGLQVGDFVLVNKHSYGLKFPGYYFPLTEVVEPKRGDVAVFMPPHSLCKVKPEEARPDLASLTVSESQNFLMNFLSQQEKKCSKFGIKYVKRIIGLPGDHVEIKGYKIYVNGEQVISRLINNENGEIYYQDELGGKTFLSRRMNIKENESHEWHIPEDRYLAIGDNRDNSLDSRAWGYVSKEYLVGTADYVWMSWTSFSEFPSFKRNKRIK